MMRNILILWGTLSLAGCFSGPGNYDITTTIYTAKPISIKKSTERIDNKYIPYILPISDQKLCDAALFKPLVRFSRLDTAGAPVFDAGKLGESQADGLDSFFGVMPDINKLKEASSKVISSWQLKDELYQPANTKSFKIEDIVVRDKPTVIVLISDDATLRESEQNAIKKLVGKDAPTILQTSEAQSSQFNAMLLSAICNKSDIDLTKQSVALFFLEKPPMGSQLGGSAHPPPGEGTSLGKVDPDITKKKKSEPDPVQEIKLAPNKRLPSDCMPGQVGCNAIK